MTLSYQSSLADQRRLPYYLCSVNHIEEIADKAFNFVDIHGHLPILTDVHPNGQRFRLQEAGAIAQYLIAHYDIMHKLSYSTASAEDTEVNNWLFFLTSRLGPNHEEAVHFLEPAAKNLHGTSRFAEKVFQLYLALERHLQKSQVPYIVDNKWQVVTTIITPLFTITLNIQYSTVADVVYVPYVADAKSAGIDIEQFPALVSWYKEMLQRPAVTAGFNMVKGNGAREI